jgi:hypothetical protein
LASGSSNSQLLVFPALFNNQEKKQPKPLRTHFSLSTNGQCIHQRKKQPKKKNMEVATNPPNENSLVEAIRKILKEAPNIEYVCLEKKKEKKKDTLSPHLLFFFFLLRQGI